jgi:hypothetical protein
MLRPVIHRLATAAAVVGLAVASLAGAPAAAKPLATSTGLCGPAQVPGVLEMSEQDALDRLHRFGFNDVEVHVQKGGRSADPYPLVVRAQVPAGGVYFDRCQQVLIILGE